MKTKEKQGITLIALVITIIVLLILAGVSIAVLTGDNGTITKAVESKFKTELAGVQEEYELYVIDRISKNKNFEEGALYAGKNALIYNSIQEEGNIYTVLKNSKKKYVDCFEIIKGELIYSSQNKQQLDWAQEIGIKISPYLIIDGELMSAETNLYLMDEETGTITIPENVTKIGAGAFRDVEGLRSIVIPSTVKEISDHAFSGNPTLENVVIEEGVEKIGNYAFESCSSLKSIHIANSVSSIGDYCFSYCTKLVEINIPNSLTNISYGMLRSCNSLKELIIPEGIINIQGEVFRGDSNLETIKIPVSVTNINWSAFKDNPKLNLEIAENNKIYSVVDGLVTSKDGKNLYFMLTNSNEINIPETIETISSGTFGNITQTVTLNVSSNVKTINALPERINSINVADDNEVYKSLEGSLYSKDITILYKCTQNINSFKVPDTVKTIKANSFYHLSNLTNLTLSRELETMEQWLFAGVSIKELNLPSKLKNIHYQTFGGVDITISIASDNPNFKVVDGTMLLSKDGKQLYLTSKNLKTYNIPNTVETIKSGAFYYKTSMTEIEIPTSVKTIENNIGAPNLPKIEIPATVNNIGSLAFVECKALKEIIIHKSKLPDGSDSISGSPWGCPYGLRAVKWKE